MTNETNTADIARARRERLTRYHLDYLSELREAAPNWCDIAEDSHDTVYSPEACELLAETAPDGGYLQGFWLGRAVALREIQALTQRESID
tara:strand:+ start:229 stop:501 length:273 start_codon:yes stop_codon:yes gene_type:complete